MSSGHFDHLHNFSAYCTNAPLVSTPRLGRHNLSGVTQEREEGVCINVMELH